MKKLIIGILLVFSSFVWAVIPDKPTSRIIDQAHLLTASQDSAINRLLAMIYNQTNGTEIEILTIESLGEQTIEDLSINTARKWGIGQKKLNNGILILISKNDKQTRIEVGYGLEGVIPDGFAGRLERQILAPNFESGNYYQGLNLALDQISQQVIKDYKGKPPAAAGSMPSSNLLIYIVLGIIILVIVVVLISTGNTELLFNILILVFRAVAKGKGSKSDDIGKGGGFGGGGSSSKW